MEVLFTIGDKKILNQKQLKDGNYIILAKWKDEYITWFMDSNQSLAAGHYFDNYADAFNDFLRRD